MLPIVNTIVPRLGICSVHIPTCSEQIFRSPGLIIADSYDAEIIRMGPETKLAPARRKVMVQKFARHAAIRAQAARDPGFVVGF